RRPVRRRPGALGQRPGRSRSDVAGPAPAARTPTYGAGTAVLRRRDRCRYRRRPGLPSRHGAQPRAARAGSLAEGSRTGLLGRRCAMTDPLESALRTMLHERAADITNVSFTVLDLDHPRPSRPSPASHRSWLLVAASIVTVLAVAGAVVGIRHV